MNNRTLTATILAVSLVLSGCLGIRQVDLDAWEGVPVEELDLHPFFSTLGYDRTFTDDGLEIRNYRNESVVGMCIGLTCSSRLGGCNNQFLIREGIVMEYRPIGYGGVRCKTGADLQPMP